MFFCDLMLFYVIPLLLSMVLYSLIARMLLSASRNKFGGGGGGGAAMSNGGGGGGGSSAQAMSVSEAAAKSNQARVQVRNPLKPLVFFLLGSTVYTRVQVRNPMKPLFFSY